MPFVLYPGVCAFEAPRGWTWETVEGVVSLFREDGSGVAQVAIVPAVGNADAVLKQELQRFSGGEYAVDHFTEQIPRASIQHGDERWELWVIASGPKAATITFHPSAAFPGEMAKVEKLVRSFQWDR